MAAPPIARVRVCRVTSAKQREIKIRRAFAERQKLLRHHPHDQDRLLVERNGASDQRTVASKTPHPESVIEHGYLSLTKPVFIRQEGSAKHGGHAMGSKPARRNARRGQLLRIADAGQIRIAVSSPSEVFEDISEFPPFPVGS